MVAIEFAGRRHFLEFFSHKVPLRSRPSRGISLLKNVSREKPREIALRVLQLRQGGQFVEHLLEARLAQSRLDSRDRNLCQELVYGAVRWEATLDWLIGRKTGGRVQNPMLQNLLRLGLYQIFWLERIPNHAAVHETVELAKQRGFRSQSGFVNAVLRDYLRQVEPTRQLLAELKTQEPALGYSHPEWLVARWEQRWGRESVKRLLAWNNTPAKSFARVNTLRNEAGKLLSQWRDEGVDYDFVRRDWLEENLVFELKNHPPLHELSSFTNGWFYVQDPSTLLAVTSLAPHPGEHVLDLCAAPGGKLTYIAQVMGNCGSVAAHDLTLQRLKLVQENCARLGVACVEVFLPAQRPLPSSGDSGPISNLSGMVFEKILVDAPCTNTGVMRRRVDLRWRVRPEEIERLSQAQVDLLRQSVPMLKPGGTLVYSTCSLEPEENELVVKQFLSEQPEFELVNARQLLPFIEEADGAYVATLKRKK
jgi:16S rRNA (cytosine967-C5)-methyltransferase